MVKRQRQHVQELAETVAKLKDALPAGHPLAAKAGNVIAAHERMFPRPNKAIAPPPDHQLNER